MSLDFKFRLATVHLGYRAVDLSGLRKGVEAIDKAEFSVTGSLATQFALTSPSGHSQGMADVNAAVININFSGEFEKIESWEKRKEYIIRKVKALSAIVGGSETFHEFIGVTMIARSPGDDSLRERAFKSVVPSTCLTQNQPVVDFTLRASHALGVNGFFNAYVSWFQTRMFNFMVPRQTFQLMVREWEGALTEQGLEIRFDFNNKKGLYDGKRDWTTEEILELTEAGLREIKSAFEKLQAQCADNEGE